MNGSPLPGQMEQSQETLCPACGRFVGALNKCPNCGTKVEKRMSIVFFRNAALLLGIVGLGLLYLMSINKEIPVVKIEDIKPTMNFGYIRVAGVVSGDSRVFKEGGRVRSLRFAVDDGTGEIMVNAYRAQAQELVDADKLPRMGDRVEVAGNLSATEADMTMRLQVAEHLSLTRAELEATPLKDVTSSLVGTTIMVEGKITRVNPPREGSKAPWTVTIADSSGVRDLTFWDDIYAEISDKMLLMPGTLVSARVSVRSYKDEIQLSLIHGADLTFTAPGSGEASAPKAVPAKSSAPKSAASRQTSGSRYSQKANSQEITPIAAITREMDGKRVVVSGRVAELKGPEEEKAPHQIVLQDGDSRITVVYWDSVASRLKANKPVIGALMNVRGTVSVYKEALQIKVNHSDQLTLVEVAPASKLPTAAAEEVKIGSINTGMLGDVVRVRGKLGEPVSVKNGVIYPLSDESGTIKVVLWDRAVPERDHLSAGLQAAVIGEVREYKGELEVVPANSQSIQTEDSAR